MWSRYWRWKKKNVYEMKIINWDVWILFYWEQKLDEFWFFWECHSKIHDRNLVDIGNDRLMYFDLLIQYLFSLAVSKDSSSLFSSVAYSNGISSAHLLIQKQNVIFSLSQHSESIVESMFKKNVNLFLHCQCFAFDCFSLFIALYWLRKSVFSSIISFHCTQYQRIPR